MLCKFRCKLAQYLYKVSVTGSTETVEPQKFAIDMIRSQSITICYDITLAQPILTFCFIFCFKGTNWTLRWKILLHVMGTTSALKNGQVHVYVTKNRKQTLVLCTTTDLLDV